MSSVLVPEGYLRQGKQLLVQFTDLGNGAHGRAIFIADGELDEETDLVISEGGSFSGNQPLIRYRPTSEGGGFARGVYSSDGDEDAFEEGDIAVSNGRVPVMFKSMDDGTHAEVVFESDDNGLQVGDAVVVDGSIPVRYKNLGNGAFARTVIFSDGDEEEPESEDRIVPFSYPMIGGQASRFFKALGDGSYAEVYFADGGVPPEENPVDGGLMLENRYILLGDDNLVLP